jgi:hypothetical protein
MTCINCERIFEDHDRVIYTRICIDGNCSNVAIHACPLHGKWILDAVSEKYQREKNDSQM